MRIEDAIEHLIVKNPLLSLNDIASQLNRSPKYLSRIFRQNKGISFREFKLKLKMNFAKEKLLDESSKNITKISSELGYKNSTSLMRIFKKKEKQTLKGYRKDNGIDDMYPDSKKLNYIEKYYSFMDLALNNHLLQCKKDFKRSKQNIMDNLNSPDKKRFVTFLQKNGTYEKPK